MAHHHAKGGAGAPPPHASSVSQLKTVLHKNLLLKRRAYKTTFCEIASPALFLSILVLGYYLSSTDHYAEGMYAKTTLSVAPLAYAILPIFEATSTNESLGLGLFDGLGGGLGRRQRRRQRALQKQQQQQGGGVGDGGGSTLDLWALRGSLLALLNGLLPASSTSTSPSASACAGEQPGGL